MKEGRRFCEEEAEGERERKSEREGAGEGSQAGELGWDHRKWTEKERLQVKVVVVILLLWRRQPRTHRRIH